MKESISYAFLLNIVLTFIFVCFTIVMGTFSYYRAFRANKIISQTIEKYEGYNCASKKEIATKLNNISYSTPFNVRCGLFEICVTNSDMDYKIIPYDLSEFTEKEKKQVNNDKMNSKAEIENYEVINQTREYQYGIYTYMYVDLPILSSFIKIPFFSKTDVLYEFRDLAYTPYGKRVYDKRNLPDGKTLSYYNLQLKSQVLENFSAASSGEGEIFNNIYSFGYVARERVKIDTDENGIVDTRDHMGQNFETQFTEYGTDECKTRTFSKS